MAGLAAIETTDQIMDRLKLATAQLGIATIRKLEISLTAKDEKATGQMVNEEFVAALMKCHLYLSKIDASSITRAYKVDDLTVNYQQFMDHLSPKLSAEREKIVHHFFELIQQHTNQKANTIKYSDLLSLCDFKSHPAVQSGQFSANTAREVIKAALDGIQNENDEITYPKFQHLVIKAALDGIQNENDEITYPKFQHFFRGIASAYPYNTQALVNFIQSCWHSVYKHDNHGNISVEEANKYVEQIEAMLAEKTRQKLKGSESEVTCLTKQFKFYDGQKLGYLNYATFTQTLESFGVMAPEKELMLFFDKWCTVDGDTKKFFYRPFVTKLFQLH
eukprot:CAMPEP_0197072076 /NCGR_PEP_ID=MMETSP1384-20130603/209914_1 /TAXON_ID=29189 /ORGANISM="Ammonia sp." /LENGTH=333 /DNA_ID=CAMNT_0042510889 /DNA_START=66 /DNA_END=1067 /DNA_ORIENTATION=-